MGVGCVGVGCVGVGCVGVGGVVCGGGGIVIELKKSSLTVLFHPCHVLLSLILELSMLRTANRQSFIPLVKNVMSIKH